MPKNELNFKKLPKAGFFTPDPCDSWKLFPYTTMLLLPFFVTTF